jgi:hypothetical protein
MDFAARKMSPVESWQAPRRLAQQLRLRAILADTGRSEQDEAGGTWPCVRRAAAMGGRAVSQKARSFFRGMVVSFVKSAPDKFGSINNPGF